MNIFDKINENIFSPLSGSNKKKYMDILSLIWDKCKRMPMYAVEKSTIFAMIEDYFNGLDEKISLDSEEEQDEIDIDILDARATARIFIRRLKETGWILEKDGEYDEESKLAINYKIVPLIKSFQQIVSPTIITYKGKLFKIYSMFLNISEQGSPYENVLKEASGDFDELNLSLRTLATSIEDHINELTKGKSAEEILNFFEKYEDEIVVGSYQRFKTNDNLSYYKNSLYEALDQCEYSLFEALVFDYMDTEKVEKKEAAIKIKELIIKIRMDIEEMNNIMNTIDNRHIIYRTRAVQRAQFLLSSDGSVKSKINNILQYYSNQIVTKENLNEIDDTICGEYFQIFGQNYIDYLSLTLPVKKKHSSPIEAMVDFEELNLELVKQKNEEMREYIRNALTSENVNSFAKEILQHKSNVTISEIFKDSPNSLTKIIGLYTYSRSSEREYDIEEKEEYIECNGFKFKDFSILKRRNTDGK